MPNPGGKNGHDNGDPPDDLPALLQSYASKKVPLPRRVELLGQKNYHISLKKLNKEYSIVSPRRPPPEHVATTLIAAEMAQNITGSNGPNTIQLRVALQTGVALPRAMVRSTMKALDPHGPARRFPAKRPVKERGVLTDNAVFYEVHFDGHEKLNFKALQMGRASIDMYGGRCHGSGLIALLQVVPNARCGVTVGHFYLDLAEEFGYIPVQNTVDGGTETRYMTQMHNELRTHSMPRMTDTPAVVALPSTDNIPIESLWSYLRNFIGRDLKAAILLGKTENYMNVTDEVHIHLFRWIWSRIVQNAANLFVEYWNTHKTRNQRNKALPSGVSPQDVFEKPQNFGLEFGGIEVDREFVRELRKTLPKSREECYRWVPEDFEVQAVVAYEYLGSPALRISEGWTIFSRMLAILEA
ncbi:hypothetical protein FB45DRAFT_1106958 [Roridomyces roridus]|uniref:Integrase core domain-containing protein n=1 Tax=Roridomyces roridus TaxID=1738132 RepID=A0AAD7FEX6_9AGAR|nr:hypothetical protein FB45DRAFT_1106958 [Roridomyces roridus]